MQLFSPLLFNIPGTKKDAGDDEEKTQGLGKANGFVQKDGGRDQAEKGNKVIEYRGLGSTDFLYGGIKDQMSAAADDDPREKEQKIGKGRSRGHLADPLRFHHKADQQ